MIPFFTSAYNWLDEIVVFIIFIIKYLQKSSDSLSLTTLLVPKPVLGPGRGTLAAGPVRGAVGPPAVAVSFLASLLDASRDFVLNKDEVVPWILCQDVRVVQPYVVYLLDVA